MSRSASSKASTSGHPGGAEELGLAFEFFTEIGIISQLSSNYLQRHMPHGLTQSQFGVLNWFVRVDDEATPGRLAKAFQVTGGAMTNTLSKLAAKGFVTIEPDPESGRRKIVRMTKSGRAARDAAIASVSTGLMDFLAAFPSDRLKRALPLLRTVRGWLDEERD